MWSVSWRLGNMEMLSALLTLCEGYPPLVDSHMEPWSFPMCKQQGLEQTAKLPVISVTMMPMWYWDHVCSIMVEEKVDKFTLVKVSQFLNNVGLAIQDPFKDCHIILNQSCLYLQLNVSSGTKCEWFYMHW